MAMCMKLETLNNETAIKCKHIHNADPPHPHLGQPLSLQGCHRAALDVS